MGEEKCVCGGEGKFGEGKSVDKESVCVGEGKFGGESLWIRKVCVGGGEG